ncbi:MAG: MarR family transcriptional regulator [Gemmatimonadales bacterium]
MACHTRHVRDPGSERLLSARQASILDHLDTIEPTTLGGLARHTGVTPATMSLAVERLVRDGYVRRRRDRVDARRVGLTLTDAGTQVREANSVLDPERVRLLLEQLPRADRTAGVRGLALLADAAYRVMASKRLYGLRGRSGAIGASRRTHDQEEPV